MKGHLQTELVADFPAVLTRGRHTGGNRSRAASPTGAKEQPVAAATLINTSSGQTDVNPEDQTHCTQAVNPHSYLASREGATKQADKQFIFLFNPLYNPPPPSSSTLPSPWKVHRFARFVLAKKWPDDCLLRKSSSWQLKPASGSSFPSQFVKLQLQLCRNEVTPRQMTALEFTKHYNCLLLSAFAEETHRGWQTVEFRDTQHISMVTSLMYKLQ